MTSAKELRELSLEELAAREAELRQELFNLRFQTATHQLENPMRIRSVRRTIARVKTILQERRRGVSAGGPGSEA
ncbi:50S ribosomal protein L29 [Dissulfurirhabdus thermomarina]|uniref:Large ribosomal subunit protein uL29 n=1 Tax=Dissulfurirhabdus thermomarina TaxID=1765737 RepID=A0A6N9TRV9_DISTH|nr:50S ribosomal protein L29 [Dissulfurirhabdus thermomarina]NDY41316.1 50S ribosomal protein L29 [Dissulfurirhabdus thermomarina]NMX23301.1 50S ribosomal protein L29 [Dissulfurirhabdus thermomarina]